MRFHFPFNWYNKFGTIPSEFREAMSYEEQILWLCQAHEDLQKQFDEFKSSVAKCLDKANDNTLSADDINNLSTDWENKRKYLHVFIPHTEIKEIGLWLSEATAFAEFGNMEETADKLQVIYDLSKQIPDNFRIKIENIM